MYCFYVNKQWSHLCSSDQRNRTTNLNSTDNNNTSSSDNVITTNKPNLLTDLTSNLSAQEINLLSKGPKFSLSPGISEHTITGINIAFYRLANQIRWKHFRESRFQPSDFLTYPQSDTSTNQNLKTNSKESSKGSTTNFKRPLKNYSRKGSGRTSATQRRE